MRLIDIDDALKSMPHLPGFSEIRVRLWLDEQPAIDLESLVKRGRWISWKEAENFIPSPDRHECSVCHDAAQVLVNGIELLSDWCPNCGAKMVKEDA